jgi:hypothetical protein
MLRTIARYSVKRLFLVAASRELFQKFLASVWNEQEICECATEERGFG